VIRTGRHVFIDAPDDLLIVPAGAFETENEMAAFAEVWENASRDPWDRFTAQRVAKTDNRRYDAPNRAPVRSRDAKQTE